MKILFDKNPMPPTFWPVSWIAPAEDKLPSLTHYRLTFQVEEPAVIILHVTADEQYRLYLDGKLVGRGSDSGSLSHWYFDSWQVELTPGTHELTAKVPCWGIGSELGPQARISQRPAFLLAASDTWMEKLGTGLADWKCTVEPLEVTGNCAVIHCRYRDHDGEPLGPVRILYRGRSADEGDAYNIQPLLTPSIQPEMFTRRVTPAVLSSSDNCDDPVILHGPASEMPERIKELEIPPGGQCRIVMAFEDYVCAFSKIRLSGGAGAEIGLKWAEAAFEKDNRAQVYGKEFKGIGDSYVSSGRADQCFEPIYWNSGRLVELTVRNAAEPLVIHAVEFIETHYPIVPESRFDCNRPEYRAVTPLLLRTLKMCTHDVFMDCPYYERLMYIGDARTEALTLMAAARDDRPVRNALTMFAKSRLQNELVMSRYPTRLAQNIPPYALLFINMLHDYALWRGNAELVRPMLPRVREILAVFEPFIDGEGLLHRLPGWNFIDWVEGWDRGVPRVEKDAICGVLNWQYIYALADAARLEEHFGHGEFAAFYRRRAQECAGAVIRHFWDAKRGLFADDTAHRHFSEHSQSLAVLSGMLSEPRMKQLGEGLVREPELDRTTVYFSHYLFEAAHCLKRPELFYPRLKYWFDLPAQGFKTVPERPEPSRSDCHAWGTHPYYHFFATILGIRPADYGFKTVDIAPMPGALTHINGTMVHPQGEIRVDLQRTDEGLEADIRLPQSLTGIFNYRGCRCLLRGGLQKVTVSRRQYSESGRETEEVLSEPVN